MYYCCMMYSLQLRAHSVKLPCYMWLVRWLQIDQKLWSSDSEILPDSIEWPENICLSMVAQTKSLLPSTYVMYEHHTLVYLCRGSSRVQKVKHAYLGRMDIEQLINGWTVIPILNSSAWLMGSCFTPDYVVFGCTGVPSNWRNRCRLTPM